jgi:peptidoglycan lytic transglycosylase G
VADLLTENDVVSNGTLFEWRLKLAGKTGSILPGRYVLAHNMSYSTAIDRLTSSGGKVNVTIPEGEDRTQIAATIGDLGLSGDYLAASRSSKGFDPNRYGANNPKSLEGFLFPATYELDPGASADQLVAEQLDAFQQNIASVNLSYAKSKNLTVYDVLTIASMIDKEVMVPSERPLVAAVIYNRLHRGMPLGIDATTRYEFHNYTGEITQSQLESPSPYNTRTHVGLPPTPIGNPGLAAIQAAARPAKVNYLYYVVNGDGSGRHCFTASGTEFDQLVAASTSGQATPNCRS